MARLKINGIEVEVKAGATVLDAASLAGADVPTLCYERKAGPMASCMLCVVRDARSGRMLPACAAPAEDGMDIDTRGEEVTAARRETLLMLLAEHAGDCEAPCSRVCPAGLDIPRMLRCLAAGHEAGAARIARRDLIFPATLGVVCPAPCQNVCRRGQYDSAVEIRACHGVLKGGDAPSRAADSGRRVAVVGGGLAGLSAAHVCALLGHSCRVYDESPLACAELRAKYPELPAEILDGEIASICKEGVELLLGTPFDIARLADEYDAVIDAAGGGLGAVRRTAPILEHSMAVRAVENGKRAAREADVFLRSAGVPSHERRYNSSIGKLRAEELEAYAVTRRTVSPATEADRCLGCDCRTPATCKLRRYAEQYGIRGAVARHMERPAVSSMRVFGPVMFEAGKCIKCGICVELCRQRGGGLTFAGRGLDTRVELTPGAMLSDQLALRCAEACPTGALALSSFEDTV